MELQELKDGTVDLINVSTVYDEIMGIYSANHKKINSDIEKGGKVKKKIGHGDYGYFVHGNEKLTRLFLNTSQGKLEAFCTKAGHHKCYMGTEVNTHPKDYFICGNIFDLVELPK
jgi:hypothetical protein